MEFSLADRMGSGRARRAADQISSNWDSGKKPWAEAPSTFPSMSQPGNQFSPQILRVFSNRRPEAPSRCCKKTISVNMWTFFLFFFPYQSKGVSLCVYVSVCMMPPYRTDQISPDTPRDRTIYKCIQRQKNKLKWSSSLEVDVPDGRFPSQIFWPCFTCLMRKEPRVESHSVKQ